MVTIKSTWTSGDVSDGNDHTPNSRGHFYTIEKHSFVRPSRNW